MKEAELRSIKRVLEGLVQRIDHALNDETATPFKEMTAKQQSDYIIDGVCDFWEIDRKELLKKNNGVAGRRRYAAVLMRDYASMSQEDMASVLGYENHSNLNRALKRMDEKLSEESWGDSRMRAIYENLIKYLNLPDSRYFNL
jgi:chromosomal replication initiation ATPase DnaA